MRIILGTACVVPLATWGAGCASGDFVPDPLHPSVELHAIDPESLHFGERRDFRLSVTNTTVEPILIRSIELPHQLPIYLDLMTALEGRIDEKPSFGYFDLSTGFRDLSPRVFADDTLLLPAETTVFEPLALRVRRFEERVTVHYQSVSFSDLLRLAYFPEPRRGRSTTQRFRKVPYSGLSDYKKGEPGTLERVVLVPDAAAFGPEHASEHAIKMPIVDFRTPGSLVAIAGASTLSSVTRWEATGLWIIDDPVAEETFAIELEGDPAAGLAGLKGTRAALPRCDIRAFDLFDDLTGEGHPGLGIMNADGLPARLTSTADVWKLLEGARENDETLALATFEGPGGLPFSEIEVIRPEVAGEVEAEPDPESDAAPEPEESAVESSTGSDSKSAGSESDGSAGAAADSESRGDGAR